MSCSDKFLLQRVFGVLDFSAWFLAILPAALLRRTQEKQLSFATLRLIQKVGTFWVSACKSTGLTHIFCFGKRKVEEKEKRKVGKAVSFLT